MQGKDSTVEKSTSERVLKDDLYPLSRSATDPSHCASLQKSNCQNLSPTSVDNSELSGREADLSSDLSSLSNQHHFLSDERKLSNPYFCTFSNDEKSYQERPSFKVEGLLTHHLNSNQSQGSVNHRGSLDASGQTSFESDLNSLSEPRNEFFDCEEQPPPNNELPNQSDIRSNFIGLEETALSCVNTEEFKDSLEGFAFKVAGDAIKLEAESETEPLNPIQEVSENSVEAKSANCTEFSLNKGETSSFEEDNPLPEFANLDITSSSGQEVATPSLNVDPQSPDLQVPNNDEEKPLTKPVEEVYDTPESPIEKESELNSSNEPVQEGDNYFEFVFEEPKKPLKAPPKFLGRKNQAASKRRTRNRGKPNNKEVNLSTSPPCVDKSLPEDSNCSTTEIVEKVAESVPVEGNNDCSSTESKITREFVTEKQISNCVESSSSLLVGTEEEFQANPVEAFTEKQISNCVESSSSLSVKNEEDVQANAVEVISEKQISNCEESSPSLLVRTENEPQANPVEAFTDKQNCVESSTLPIKTEEEPQANPVEAFIEKQNCVESSTLPIRTEEESQAHPVEAFIEKQNCVESSTLPIRTEGESQAHPVEAFIEKQNCVESSTLPIRTKGESQAHPVEAFIEKQNCVGSSTLPIRTEEESQANPVAENTEKQTNFVESSSLLRKTEEEPQANFVEESLSDSDKETLEIRKQIERDLENFNVNEIITPSDFSNCAKLAEAEVKSYFSTKQTTSDLPVENAPSIISISCYGNEEFEVLGNEANRLAEELSTTESTVLLIPQNMEEKTTTDERPKSSESSSTPNEGLKSDIKNISPANANKIGKFSTKKESHTLQVNDSEAGPDIAPGLTSSDLKCASQFFKEAAELESQIRRNIAASVGSLNDFTGESSTFSENETYAKSVAMSSPPHEERSAPEGTSSPDPRSLEDSEVRSRLQRSPECSSNYEVNELLKKQALEFEEKLLRQGIVAAEKEKELHELLKEEQKKMQNVTASRDALLKLVEKYKGMLGALLSEKEKAGSNQEEKIRTLENEKQQAIEDLNNVEAAFSDVHRKYERTKQIVDSLRHNEETLRNAVADYEEKLLKQERKFVELQKHAEEKVKLANEEFEALRRSNDQEMTKMGALLKKAEMKIISLQESLERKTRENQELTQLCDDLISKVGS